jgi:hypothetical protein
MFNEVLLELFPARYVKHEISQFHFFSNQFMISPQKTIASILLVVASLNTFSTQVIAGSGSFRQALAKTQQQQYTEAIQDLGILGRQLQKQGDIFNAYRSQATASVIRHERDSLTEYKEKGARSALPVWRRFGTCLNSDKNNKEESCFGASWVTPITNIKNFGGLVVFDNHLEYINGSASIRGILDTAVVPRLQNNELVTSFCKINSGAKKGQQALALVTYNAKQNKYTKIRQAWYPDFQTRRIQQVKTNLVSCTSDLN